MISRPSRFPLLVSLLLTACGGTSSAPEVQSPAASGEDIGTSVDYPREWTAIDRASPDLQGRYGPHDWTPCRGQEPCVAITFSPIEYDGDRPTMTLLITFKRVWRTRPAEERWRRKWRWVDPLLGACLGGALSLDQETAGVTRRLVEQEDGFWWTYTLDSVGPCDIRGGIELAATEEAGRSTRLTAGSHPWGTPAAVGFATDVLHQTYGGPIGPR
jgi:hypothetical protein